MDPPPGFVAKGQENYVCRLKKSLNGLKQSPRAWFDRFSKVVIRHVFTRCHADHAVFVKRRAKKVVILVVYVDDVVVTGDDDSEISNLKSFLKTEFEIKDLGLLKYFLGIEMARSRCGIAISQRKYILDLLKETRKQGAKPVDTPIEQNHGLHIESGELLKRKKTLSKVGGKVDLSHHYKT